MGSMGLATTADAEHRPVPVEQLASKDCLVCGRAYRYSHNARRHERNAHCYDRYTNKVESGSPSASIRSIPYKSKARLLHNSGENISSKTPPLDGTYSMKRKLLSDFRNKGGQPEILKSLLTARSEVVVSESENVHSGSESPETFISEPELPPYQVEAILSVPDTYMENSDMSDDDNDMERSRMDSDVEVDISSQLDINRIIGIEQDIDKDDCIAEEMPHDMAEDEGNLDEEDEHESRLEIDTSIVPDSENKPNNSDVTHDDVDDDDDDDIPVPIVPIVEIDENPHPDNLESDESESDDESPDDNRLTVVENNSEDSLTITSAQKAFIVKYRDLIEQINTMKCKCCDRDFPRRKAVIQHLQKNGCKIPKHTCYSCVLPFTHIGALLSHMRYNCCNDTWKLIYREDGIPDNIVVDEIPPTDIQDCGSEEILKTQYKDILSARSYSCKLCPAQFQLKQFIMRHIYDMHESATPPVHLQCFNCKYKFIDNRLWKKHVRNGECTVNISCDLCSEKFLTMQDFNEHAISVHTEDFVNQSSENHARVLDGRPTHCPICDKSLSNYHNLVKHLKVVHNEEKPHMCQHCDSKFGHVTELNHHIYIEHSERMLNGDDIDLSIVKEEITAYNYSCTDCSAVFETVDGWTEHQISVHHHIAHECDQCEKKFWDEGELEEHKNVHLRVKLYKCMLCSNSYSSSHKLSEHMNQLHQESTPEKAQFYCDICIRSFKSRQAFSNHMRIHAKVPTTNRRSGEVKRNPDIQYRTPNHVQHQPPPLPVKTTRHSDQAPYSCDICGKGFLHKKNIWKHKKMLHPDIINRSKENIGSVNIKNASTEEDDYMNDDQYGRLSIPQFDSFVTTVYDQPENSGSENVLLYQCDLCDKRFAVKSSIWKHKRVKHGVLNPGQQEVNKYDLIKPELKTENAKSDIARTSCTICKINFPDKKAYYRHRKTAHKVSIQVCKICGITLNTSMELFEHLQTAHAKELLGYNASQGKPPKTMLPVRGQNSSDEDDISQDTSISDNHKDGKYSCETCGKGFQEMVTLQNHNCLQRVAISETYDCEICNKSYTSISALKSHRGWHLRSPDGRAAFSNSGLWMPQNKVTNKVSKHEVIETTPTKSPVKPPPPPLPKEMSPMQIKRKLPPDVQVTVLKKKKLNDDVVLEPAVTPRSEASPATRQLAITEDRYCEPCGKIFTKKAAYQRHVDEVHKPNTVFCPICNKSFTRKSTLLVHMRKHDTGDTSEPPDMDDSDDDHDDNEEIFSKLQSFRCDICNIQHNSLKALHVHMAKYHGTGDPDNSRRLDSGGDSRIIEDGVVKEYKCGSCKEEWDTEEEVWNHSHFRCTICGLYFSQQQYLAVHTRSCHPDKEPSLFPCGKCDRFYTNKRSLQRHLDTFH